MTPLLFDVQRLTYLNNGPYSFSLAEREILGFTGPSGVGKTQLLRALVGCLPADGTILYRGRPAETFTGPEWRRMVALVPAESVWWYDFVGMHFTENSGSFGTDELLTRLGFETDVLSWDVSRLSSGERQRLALVRALVLKPSIILLDEPTSALDSRSVALMEELLLDYLKKQDAAIIWVSHDSEQLGRIAGRCCQVLKDRLDLLWSRGESSTKEEY